MTLQECTKVLTTLAVSQRTELDGPTFRAYFRVLEDVPVSLLTTAAERWAKSGSPFFPKAGELRQFAEDARTALIAAHPFEPCANCSSQGWTEREIDGVKRMVRCRCWLLHRERLQALGAGSEPLALPAPEAQTGDE